MRLKPNCVRDVLLAVETLQTYSIDKSGGVEKTAPEWEDICAALPKYDPVDVIYTIEKLTEADFFDAVIETAADDAIVMCYVTGITYAGHEFLEKIRDDGRWKKLRKVASMLGDWSLSAISTAAEQLTAATISGLISQII